MRKCGVIVLLKDTLTGHTGCNRIHTYGLFVSLSLDSFSFKLIFKSATVVFLVKLFLQKANLYILKLEGKWQRPILQHTLHYDNEKTEVHYRLV